jgi:hypothetical protein
MRCVLRVSLLVLLAALVGFGPSGCGKEEDKTNPELKIPDVPPSGRKVKEGGSKKFGKDSPQLKRPDKDK